MSKRTLDDGPMLCKPEDFLHCAKNHLNETWEFDMDGSLDRFESLLAGLAFSVTAIGLMMLNDRAAIKKAEEGA